MRPSSMSLLSEAMVPLMSMKKTSICCVSETRYIFRVLIPTLADFMPIRFLPREKRFTRQWHE